MSTSKTSSKPSKAAKAKTQAKIDVDAPFDADLIRQARQIASGYRYILRPSESLGYVGRTLELPMVVADGPTPDVCLRATQFAVETAVATMLEMGDAPPDSASRRTEQINIRLTSEEKLILEEKSQRKGFRGLSDFVRAVALSEVSGVAVKK